MNSDIIVFKNSLTRKKESITIRHRMNLKLKSSYFGSGVARLNREAGQSPARSRHCEGERPTRATVREHGKASGRDELKPGELPD